MTFDIKDGRKARESLTVITLTRARVPRLARSISSVQAQIGLGGLVEHLIIIDRCRNSLDLVRSIGLDHIRWIAFNECAESSQIERIARLRNLALQEVQSEWVAFLDDDNEWLPRHLSTLLATVAANEVDAAFSHMQMLWPDGRPFLGGFHPWTPNPVVAETYYRELVTAGVFTPGSSIVRDRFDSEWRTVDMGEWLIRRQVLEGVGFRNSWTAEDIESNIGEDDVLNEALWANQVRVASTGEPTLKYYLGGMSNRSYAIQ